jgi:hypothetical protein
LRAQDIDMEAMPPASLEEAEGVYFECFFDDGRGTGKKEREAAAALCEQATGVKEKAREAELHDDSELAEMGSGRMAFFLSWKDEEGVHVDAMNKLLGRKEVTVPQSLQQRYIDCETLCDGTAARWKFDEGDGVKQIIYVYLAGTGKRLQGHTKEEDLVQPAAVEEPEEERIPIEFEKKTLLKLISRRLGALPKKNPEEGLMQLMRQQQLALVRALETMEGVPDAQLATLAQDGDIQSTKWREFRAPKPMGVQKEGERKAINAAFYTLQRVSKEEVTCLDMKPLEASQQAAAETASADRPPKWDPKKLRLPVRRAGGATAHTVLNFTRDSKEQAAASLMGWHVCLRRTLRTEHENGACAHEFRSSMKRSLPRGLTEAARLLGEEESMNLAETEMCPMFELQSIKKGYLSVCPDGRGCRARFKSCSRRWRDTDLPEPVSRERDSYLAIEKATRDARGEELRKREVGKTKAELPGGSRKSPRRTKFCADCEEATPADQGRTDEKDGKWYCNGCWATYEGTNARRREVEVSSGAASGGEAANGMEEAREAAAAEGGELGDEEELEDGELGEAAEKAEAMGRMSEAAKTTAAAEAEAKAKAVEMRAAAQQARERADGEQQRVAGLPQSAERQAAECSLAAMGQTADAEEAKATQAEAAAEEASRAAEMATNALNKAMEELVPVLLEGEPSGTTGRPASGLEQAANATLPASPANPQTPAPAASAAASAGKATRSSERVRKNAAAAKVANAALRLAKLH